MSPSFTPNGGPRQRSNSSDTATVRAACSFTYSKCRAPHRGQAARIVAIRRGNESPAPVVAGIESRRLQDGGEQPALGRKPLDAKARLALVQDHPPQQRVLRGNGVARRLLPTQQLVMQTRRIREAAVSQFGGNAVQIGLLAGAWADGSCGTTAHCRMPCAVPSQAGPAEPRDGRRLLCAQRNRLQVPDDRY